MSNNRTAGDLTNRINQRHKFADWARQRKAAELGLRIPTTIQGVSGFNVWSSYSSAIEGAQYTTAAEESSYIAEVLALTGNSSAPAPAPAPGPSGFIPTTWIDADGTDFSAGGQSIAYGNGVWIAVGLDSTNTIKRSTDNGDTWTDIDNQIPAIGNGTGIYGVATDGNGNWVAVGNRNTAAGITILYSADDGLTWNSNPAYDSGFNLTNGFSDRGWSVTYANGLWVAVGHYTVGIGWERNIKIATTFDPVNGPNWANSPAGVNRVDVFGSSNPALCVAYGNGTWCVGGQDLNATPKGSIFYSTNAGTSWTKATGSFTGQCMGIATDGNGNWVAVGIRSGTDTSPIKYSSDNGVTWTNTTTSTANLFTSGRGVTYYGGIWVAVGTGNSRSIMYSTDNGDTWSTAGTNIFGTVGNEITYSNGRWMAVGDGGSSSIKYSTG